MEVEDDVFALAASANFTAKWHLVGHDHGAMLGWKCAASVRGRAQLLVDALLPEAAVLREAVGEHVGAWDQDAAATMRR